MVNELDQDRTADQTAEKLKTMTSEIERLFVRNAGKFTTFQTLSYSRARPGNIEIFESYGDFDSDPWLTLQSVRLREHAVGRFQILITNRVGGRTRI